MEGKRGGEGQAWGGQKEKLTGWVLVCAERDATLPFVTLGWG